MKDMIPIRFVVRVARTETYACTEPGCGKTHAVTRYSYTLPDGTRIGDEAEAGDVYWDDFRHSEGVCWYWSNCDGRHLVCVLPNGHHWDIDSRASNCGSPKDREHRCWVRHGTPERGDVHVDKAGPTCTAGAGSIQADKWHGFLDHGIVGTSRAGPQGRVPPTRVVPVPYFGAVSVPSATPAKRLPPTSNLAMVLRGMRRPTR